MIESILNDITTLDIREVHFGIFGEPTIYPGFTLLARRVLDLGCEVSMASNFAKLLKEEELEIFSRFSTIEVSMDTCDIQQLKKLRSNADGRTIVYNIIKLKAKAQGNGMPAPKITMSVVLNDETLQNLPETALFFTHLGIDSCQLLDMRPMPNNLFSVSLPASQSADKEAAQKSLLVARETFQKAGIALSIDAEILRSILGERVECRGGGTKACLAPWSRLFIAPDGMISPCCEFSSVGRISTEMPLSELINSSPLRRLRRELLTGDLNHGCRTCVRAKSCAPADISAMLNHYTHTHERAETFGQPINIHIERTGDIHNGIR